MSGVWILRADVSEHSVPFLGVLNFIFIFIGDVTPTIKMEQCVPKRRHIKFRRQRVTQKKEYNIQNTAKVWNHENKNVFTMFKINIIYSLKYIEWLTIFRVVRARKIYKIYSEHFTMSGILNCVN